MKIYWVRRTNDWNAIEESRVFDNEDEAKKYLDLLNQVYPSLYMLHTVDPQYYLEREIVDTYVMTVMLWRHHYEVIYDPMHYPKFKDSREAQLINQDKVYNRLESLSQIDFFYYRKLGRMSISISAFDKESLYVYADMALAAAQNEKMSWRGRFANAYYNLLP